MEEQKLLKKKRRALDENNISQFDAACISLGNYYTNNGCHQRALDTFKELAGFYKNKPQCQMDMGRAHRIIGEIYMLLEKFEEAIEHEQIFLEMAKLSKNKVEEQRAYATIGRVHLVHGQSLTDLVASTGPLKKAEKAFLKSLIICKSLTGIGKFELIDMEARLYLNLGVTKEYLEDYDETVQYMEKALRLCRENDLFELLHQCYHTTAMFYHLKQEDMTKSLRLLNLAQSVAERLPNRTVKICETLISKSDIFIKQGDFQSAKQVLRKAYKLKTTIPADKELIEQNLKTIAAICYIEDNLITTNSTDYATKKKDFEKLGDAACQLKNYPKAINYYLNMLKYAELSFASERELIPCYVSLYQTYKDLKQYESALVYLWKEFELNKENAVEAVTTLLAIGEVYDLSEQNFWEVDNIYQRARSECHKICDLKMEKIVILKQIALREKSKMDNLVELLRDEARMANIGIDHIDEEDEEDEELSCQEKNTPDIGDDICLSELSGSDSDEEKLSENPRTTRKRGTGLVIKRNEKGETQLHQACISGNYGQVKRLLEIEHPVNIRDHAGWMPLHEAANHGYADIVRLLLEKGASINDKGGTSCDGITALHDACGNGCLSVIEVLLDFGANVTLRTDFNLTPLATLEQWYAKQQLEPVEHIFYDTVRERLMDKFQRAGMLIENSNNEISLSSSSSSRRSLNRSREARNNTTPRKSIEIYTSTSSHKSPRSIERITSNLCYNASDNSSDEDIPNVRLNKQGTIESMLEKEFPTPPVDDDNNDDDQVDEYRNVMTNLRVGNKSTALSLQSKNEIKKRKPGILNVEEVGENWLDVDLPKTKKRKVFSSFSLSLNRGNNTSLPSSNVKRHNSIDSEIKSNENNVPDSSQIDSIELDDNESNSCDAFEMMMNGDAVQRRLSRKSSNSTYKRISSNTAARKQQSSLLQAGFVQFANDNSSTIDSDKENIVSSSQYSDPPIQQISIPHVQSAPTPIVPTLTSVKVKVEEQLFNVPISNAMLNDLTIGWLADETARRYYNLKGIQPILQITTSDGAVFENTDPITVALGSIVGSNVLDWMLPSLSERYFESCRILKAVPVEMIQQTLELIQATHQLNLYNQVLDAASSRPMFKALHFQQNLEIINLANNFLQDEGVKWLAEALPSLSQLKKLDLSGNHITIVGISYLSTKIGQNPNTLAALETLNLGCNPLKTESVSGIAQICLNLKKLQSLNLEAADITDFAQCSNDSLAGITELNISMNRQKPKSLFKLLSQLNTCKLVKLNVKDCLLSESTIDLGDVFASFLNSGTLDHLKKLNLSKINLSDSDVFQIIPSLRRAKHLTHLYLNGNPQIGSVSFKLMLQQLCVTNLSITGCDDLFYNFDLDNLNFTGTQCGTVKLTIPYGVVVSHTDDEYERFMVRVKGIWTSLVGTCGTVTVVRKGLVLLTKDDG